MEKITSVWTQRTFPFVLVTILIATAYSQTYKRPEVQPSARESDCVCKPDVTLCKCTFVVEYRLTMVLHEERELVLPYNGQLQGLKDNRILNDTEASRVITTDGEGSRLVIAINGVFPGPRVEVFENQEIEITVVNKFHTDSISVHFHGIHQTNTPWMDGVAFVTQCPILPGQTFVYRFKAYPPGTSFYHAHIGNQRSMGLYGPFIVRERVAEPISEIIVSLQDWNHEMDAETAYLRMITEQYDFDSDPIKVIPITNSTDGAEFSRFAFQSGLVNGKGRYYRNRDNHNHAPLERFKVRTGELYRFRVIGAMTLYPMRVYIEGYDLSLRSSDCFNLKNRAVQSIIIHPGERFDFHVIFQASNDNRTNLFLIAETIETAESHNSYHAAEAVIEIVNIEGTPDYDPVNSKLETCTTTNECKVFNCPYGHTGTNIRSCLNFNDVQSSDPFHDPKSVSGNIVDNEYFFNFGFPGFQGNTPGSVNGRHFILPPSPLLTQPQSLSTQCDVDKCRKNGICECTHIVEIPKNKLIQMTFMNVGKGSGSSHPIHLHGHAFFVMKMGFGTYDADTGELMKESTDIRCRDKYNFCSEPEWSDSSWKQGNIPNQNAVPAIKDTVVVPKGGYVVTRFVSDNPGMWFLHCHIDLHNTNGMGMVINIGPGNHPDAPNGFPQCGNFYYVIPTSGKGRDDNYPLSVGGIFGVVVGCFFAGIRENDEDIPLSVGGIVGTAIGCFFAGFVIAAIVYFYNRRRKNLSRRRNNSVILRFRIPDNSTNPEKSFSNDSYGAHCR